MVDSSKLIVVIVKKHTSEMSFKITILRMG